MIEKKKIIALLPMKAHSARVSGKNFRELHGKPLYRWILDTLLSMSEVDRVVINTDATQILAQQGIQSSERVKVRDRAEELCGDEVSMNRIIKDDIDHEPADIYLMTHTTNPFLSAETIREALAEFLASLRQGESDSLFTVNRFQTRFYRKSGEPVNHDPDNLIPTQELEPWFEENSNLYLFTRESFNTTNARIGRSPLLFEMRKQEAVDIDDEEDWELAVRLASIPGRFHI